MYNNAAEKVDELAERILMYAGDDHAVRAVGAARARRVRNVLAHGGDQVEVAGGHHRRDPVADEAVQRRLQRPVERVVELLLGIIKGI